MRKLIWALCLAALLVCLMASGCGKTEYQAVVLHTPSAAGAYAPAATAKPYSSGRAPDTTGGAEGANEPAVKAEPDQSVFDDAAFIGNSTFEGLCRYKVITHGAFYAKVGLNVLTVHTAFAENGTAPIIDELYNDTYGKVILMFGENELGWPSPSGFIQKYEELIDAVWLRRPEAEIYVVAMPPVSADYSGSAGVNNNNIRSFNAMIKDMAERRGCHYIDVPGELITSKGALPPEASADGLHLNLQYARCWADHICLCVMGVYD